MKKKRNKRERERERECAEREAKKKEDATDSLVPLVSVVRYGLRRYSDL